MSEKNGQKKEDARVRYTKMRIRNAFYELYREAGPEKITVSEICRRAEINRATFYKYYLDVPDLAEKLEEEELQKLSQKLNRPGSVFSAEEYVIEILRHIREANLESGKGNGFMAGQAGSFTWKVSRMMYEHFTHPSGRGKTKTADDDMVFSYVAAGSAGIMDYWLRTGAVLHETEVAKKIIALGSAVVESYR